MKMILSLIQPDAGEVQLLGEKVTSHSYEIFKKVGSIIENPYFYDKMTARQNKLSTFIHSQNLYIDIISLFILHHEMTNYADLLFNSFRHGIVCFSNIPLFPASLSHTILSRHILPVPITIETVD